MMVRMISERLRRWRKLPLLEVRSPNPRLLLLVVLVRRTTGSSNLLSSPPCSTMLAYLHGFNLHSAKWPLAGILIITFLAQHLQFNDAVL